MHCLIQKCPLIDSQFCELTMYSRRSKRRRRILASNTSMNFCRMWGCEQRSPPRNAGSSFDVSSELRSESSLNYYHISTPCIQQHHNYPSSSSSSSHHPTIVINHRHHHQSSSSSSTVIVMVNIIMLIIRANQLLRTCTHSRQVRGTVRSAPCRQGNASRRAATTSQEGSLSPATKDKTHCQQSVPNTNMCT